MLRMPLRNYLRDLSHNNLASTAMINWRSMAARRPTGRVRDTIPCYKALSCGVPRKRPLVVLRMMRLAPMMKNV